MTAPRFGPLAGGRAPSPTRTSQAAGRNDQFEALESRTLLTGVTLVTHGLMGDMDWVNSVADQIAHDIDPELKNVERLNLEVYGSDIDSAQARIKDGPSAIHPAGAVANYVIALDWTDFAGLVTFSGTDELAPIVASALMDVALWSPFGLAAAPATLPLHLIGHSRGGSMVAEIASKFSARNIWVDHLTLLDPRPVPHPYGDPTLNIRSNVVFADDYWRENWTPGDFDGQSAKGAFNTELSDRDFSSSDYLSNHADVHLFYAGTVDTEGDATDGIETIPAGHRSEWYSSAEDLGRKTGYYFSRTIGGARPISGIGPLFGGEGYRADGTKTGTQWPNVDSVRLSGVSQTVRIGRNLDITFRYQDRDGQTDLKLFLDDDTNPYNDIDGTNSITLATRTLDSTGEAVVSQSISLPTTGLEAGRYFLRAEVRDAQGQWRVDYDPDAITLGGTATLTSLDAAIAPDGSPLAVKVNAAGDIVLLEQAAGAWTRTNISDLVQIRDPMLAPLVWYDAKDAAVHVAIAQAGDLVLLSRDAAGVWTGRNLTTELAGSIAITKSITRFTSTDGLTNLAGLTAAGELVLFRQAAGSANPTAWAFDNISRDQLTPQGQTTPQFVSSLISYTTAWNGQNIAGIDAQGDIQSVWWAPGKANWEAANLSALTGAPQSAGAVTAYLTPWNGINLAAVNQAGKLVVTWWVPGQDWAVANMTELFGGATLNPSSISSWVTPWNALNISGADADGKLTIYWWTPEQNNWAVSPIGESIPQPTKFAGLTAPTSNTAATISLFGVDAANGHTVRFWWQPSFVGQWQQEDVSHAVGEA